MISNTQAHYDPFEPGRTPSRRKCLLFAVAVLPFEIESLERIYSSRVPDLSYSWSLPSHFPRLRAAMASIERSAEEGVKPEDVEQIRETWQICKEACVMDQEFVIAAYCRDCEGILSVPNSTETRRLAPSVQVARVLLRGDLAGLLPQVSRPEREQLSLQAIEAQRERYLRYLDDIFEPRSPVAFDPAWRSDTAVSRAKHIYESRDFCAMPILADALQDAGCEHADILTHCRDESLTHVRGCWVVDLVLGKE